MQVRKLPRGAEQISVIGLGLGIVKPGDDVSALVRGALERGINYFAVLCLREHLLSAQGAFFGGTSRVVLYPAAPWSCVQKRRLRL